LQRLSSNLSREESKTFVASQSPVSLASFVNRILRFVPLTKCRKIAKHQNSAVTSDVGPYRVWVDLPIRKNAGNQQERWPIFSAGSLIPPFGGRTVPYEWWVAKQTIRDDHKSFAWPT
jgi:hypothetical protein